MQRGISTGASGARFRSSSAQSGSLSRSRSWRWPTEARRTPSAHRQVRWPRSGSARGGAAATPVAPAAPGTRRERRGVPSRVAGPDLAGVGARRHATTCCAGPGRSRGGPDDGTAGETPTGAGDDRPTACCPRAFGSAGSAAGSADPDDFTFPDAADDRAARLGRPGSRRRRRQLPRRGGLNSARHAKDSRPEQGRKDDRPSRSDAPLPRRGTPASSRPR